MFAAIMAAEGHLDEAMVQFEEAERGDPDSPLIQEQIGHLLLRKRAWPEAEARFRRALALEPDAPTAHVGLARALVRQNRDSEALETALAALALQHQLPAGHFQLGAILSKMQLGERAILAFETGLSMQPGNVLAHRYLSRLYRRAGQLARSEHHRARLRQLDPNGAAEG
jgi:predicted Zn-dependent protease